ncbi:restriction endonuclease subunit S [Chryseobacterium sp. RR2-3-20]|uniref:restriction endonuclease subunit S n=1 Tax=Chryseobacterium sp. RR2-3-20 TaxID=2787626 RepID=UPI001AE0DB28|nr:restriction endonuclease subunit S [Chryseobacterium sp. RR2-3-20]
MKKLGEIAKFSKGKGISKSDIEENGITECIRYGELYTHYSEVINEIKSKTNVNTSTLVLSEKNDIIIPASGETTIDIATASCVLKSGIALGGDLNIIKTENNGVFLSYYLNNKKKMEIANLAQGISVVHLYSSQLASLSLNLPKLNEQSKISSFLALLDERIQTQNKIIEQLETLIRNFRNQIFKQKIRFEMFTNIWKEKTLGEIATFYSGGTPLTSKREFFNGDIPFIRSGEINSNNTEQFISELGLKNSSAKMVEIGDILYALYGATSGEVGICKIKGAINQAVLCIKSSENHYFIYSYLLHKKESIINTYLQGGQGNLSAEIVKQITISLPSLKEQVRVASFLSKVDQKIQTEKAMLEQLEIQKKYLLQQMFV